MQSTERIAYIRNLIEVARELASVSREVKHGAPSHADMIDDLADALESVLVSQ